MTSINKPVICHFVALVKSRPFVKSQEFVKTLAETITADLKLTVVKRHFYTFSPQGASLVYILAESHLAIHTWPEFGITHIDLFTCSKRTKSEFKVSLKNAFKLQKSTISIISVNMEST